MDPFCDPVAQVGAVGVDNRLDRPFHGFQCHNRRQHFHSVVRGFRFAAIQFPLGIAITHDRAPTARARVSATGAIGENFHHVV